MKVLSTDGLTKLIQLIKSNFIKTTDTVEATTVQLATVATSGSYNDLSNKPTIPSEVTENTVSGWGFTKNTGTVTKVNNVSPVNGNVTLSIPSATSDLTNDSGFITGITSSDVTTALGFTPYNASNPSGYQANKIETIKVNGTAQTITSKAVDISVPTNNNQLTNGAGYITNSALTPYALSADLSTVATSGSYNDLSNKPTIPDTSNLANKDLSNLSNTGNAKFQAPLVSGTNIKTVNGNSLLGSGDITIQSAPDIDSKSITTNTSDELQTVGVIDSNNTTNAIKTWTGTKAQYEAITIKDATTLYNITDDTDVTIPLLELLYPVGSLYIATGNVSVCPLAVLGVGTWQQKANSTLVTDINSTAPVVGNGMTLGLTDGTSNAGLAQLGNANAISTRTETYGTDIGSSFTTTTSLSFAKSLGVTTNPTKSGIEANITSTTLSVIIWERIS